MFFLAVMTWMAGYGCAVIWQNDCSFLTVKSQSMKRWLALSRFWNEIDWQFSDPRIVTDSATEVVTLFYVRLTVSKLPNKGNLRFCKNWRGVTLLSVTSKVFSRVILNRISTALDPMLRKEQAGFRKGRSCGEHIFTTRQILEQCQEWKTPCYVNFEKAFDSIHG